MKHYHSILFSLFPSILPSILAGIYFVNLGVGVVYGQNPMPPDCIVPFDTGVGAVSGTYNFPGGNGYDNRTAGCVTWTLEWQSSLSPTVTFQSSLGVASPTSYGAYTGTTIFSGTGIMTFSNLQTGTVVDTPWVRVHIVTGSSGQAKGVLYGYKTGYTGGTGGGGGGSGGGGCVGTAMTPCIVDQTGRTTVNSGQQTVTGSAVALASHAADSVCVKALVGNTINVYVGPSGVTTGTGFELAPGQGWCGNVANSNEVFVIASTTGASVAWILTKL